MKKKLKGGLETIIAIVIVVGIVAALLLTTVVPMASKGEQVIDGTTENLVKHQMNIKPGQPE